MSIFGTICFGIIFVLLVPLLLKVRRHRILFSALLYSSSHSFALFRFLHIVSFSLSTNNDIQKVEGTHHRTFNLIKVEFIFFR